MSTTITTTPRRTPRKRKAFRKLAYTSSVRKRPRMASMARQTVRIGKGPIAPKTIVTMRYSETWIAPGTTLDTRYNLNSIFSPQYAGAGHQPLGRDQYDKFYNRYRVLKVKATVNMALTSGSATPRLTMIPDNSTAAYTNVDAAAEQYGAVTTCGTASLLGPVRMTRTYYPNRISGVAKKEYEDDRFQALFSASPAENIVLHVVITDIYGQAIASGSYQANILLEYTCELFDPLPLAQS